MQQSETKFNLIRFSPAEREIMRTIGGGNISEGARICVMWGAHFWNLGLTTEMDLRHIGLVTVSSTDNYPHE
jgi:hypothetical protein